jgi:hypothetical protein
VRAVCLPSGRPAGRLDLATLGANARRATEDSSSVAYVAAPGPPATQFTLPILEAAGIPRLTDPSGATAMQRLLAAIDRAGSSGSLREAVQRQLTSSPPLR